MPKITLDTNILPADDLRSALEPRGFNFAVVSVTERELGGSDLRVELQHLRAVEEPFVWGEGVWGKGLWGGKDDANRFERLLQVIGNYSFPPPGKREDLSAGQRRQLRDAMILTAHIRDGRDVFVTNDARAFINDGRRQKLVAEFGVRIMTRAEFVAAHVP